VINDVIGNLLKDQLKVYQYCNGVAMHYSITA